MKLTPLLFLLGCLPEPGHFYSCQAEMVCDGAQLKLEAWDDCVPVGDSPEDEYEAYWVERLNCADYEFVDVECAPTGNACVQ